MCLEKNNALQAIDFFNAQLASHWEAARKCFANNGSELKPDDKCRLSFALYQYWFGRHRDGSQASNADMMFRASFGKPSLTFLCNHDAILTLVVEEGHYNTNIAKASDQTIAERALNRPLRDLELSFRVPFIFKKVTASRDVAIGDGLHSFNLLDLDLPHAELIATLPQVPDKQVLNAYLKTYLQLLHSTGRLVLLSLPDMDWDGMRTPIDFSAIATVSRLDGIDKVLGVSVEDINDFLNSRWLHLAMSVGFAKVNATKSVASLIECRSTWQSSKTDAHFVVNFGAPRVAALCSREAVIFLSLEDVIFYQSEELTGTPRRSYNDWEVAILVSVVEVIDSKGTVTGLKFDLQGSRLAFDLCSFYGYDERDQEAGRYRQRLLSFLSTEYLSILVNAEYNVIFQHNRDFGPATVEPDEIDNTESEDGETDDSEEYESDGKGASKLQGWKIAAEKAEMFGFDEVVVISQTMINSQFQSLWASTALNPNAGEAVLNRWSYQDFFDAAFKPINLRFLSNGKALVWVNLHEGTIKLMKNKAPWAGSERYQVHKLRLVFEVDVKIGLESEIRGLTSAWRSRFENSVAFKNHGGKADAWKHIYLDLQSAEFVSELSRFDSILTSRDKFAVHKIRSVISYIQSYYLPQLVSSGHHIFQTIPLWKPSPKLPSTALTAVTFQIFSKGPISRQSSVSQSRSLQPVILILGMTGGRSLPDIRFKEWQQWILRPTKGTPAGTVNMSARVFLEDFFVLLSRVNALTTVLPMFEGVEEDNKWNIDLTTWSQHPLRQGRPSNFTPIKMKGDEGVLKYKWQHRDAWTYEHEGDGNIATGACSVSCTTKNFLEIPVTIEESALEIRLSGDIDLAISFNDGSQRWSSQSGAKWAVSFSLQSTINGMQVEIAGAPRPEIRKATTTGVTSRTVNLIDPEKLLTEFLSTNMVTSSFIEVLSSLKVLEGFSQTCYPGTSAYVFTSPVFTRKGALLLQLRPYSPALPTSPASAGAPRSPVVDPRSRVKRASTL